MSWKNALEAFSQGLHTFTCVRACVVCAQVHRAICKPLELVCAVKKMNLESLNCDLVSRFGIGFQTRDTVAHLQLAQRQLTCVS
jgi:hypothetical protein